MKIDFTEKFLSLSNQMVLAVNTVIVLLLGEVTSSLSKKVQEVRFSFVFPHFLEVSTLSLYLEVFFL